MIPLASRWGERVAMFDRSTARRLIQGWRMRFLFGLAAAAALGQSGCTTLSEWVHNGFKVGPNYTPPPVLVPNQWIDTNDPKVRHGDPNLCAWWDVFDDPILTKLLHDSYANNLTVRAAGLQILQAQIARFIAKSELLPQAQNAILGYTRNMASATGGSPIGPGPTFGTALSPSTTLSFANVPPTPIAGATPIGSGTVFSPTNFAIIGSTGPSGGVSTHRFFSNIATSLNASWELDFWGLFRRNLEAADASLDQSVNNYDEMLVLLLANVATQYVEIRTLQRRLELARRNVALQEPLVAAYEKRYKAGIANSVPGLFPAQVEPGEYQGADPAAGNLPAAGQQPAVHPPGTAGPRFAAGTGRRHRSRPDGSQEARGPYPPTQGPLGGAGHPGRVPAAPARRAGIGRPVEDSVRPDRHRRGGDVPAHRHQRQHRPGVEPLSGPCSRAIMDRHHWALADVEHPELWPTPG